LTLPANGLVAGQFGRIWRRLGPRILYCFIFAAGIFLSMLHQQKQGEKAEAPNSGLERLRKLRRIAGVWTYFALLNVWSFAVNIPIAKRFRFFFSLFGL
jgi:hypothetical protein